MTDRPQVGALVLARERTGTLAEVIEALRSQTRPPDSILLVDNDGTAAVKELIAEAARSDPRVEVLELETNRGGAGGFAAGAERLAARDDLDFVWLFDDDAIPDGVALEVLLDVAGGLPRLGAAGPVSGVLDGELAWPINAVGRTEPVATAAELRALAGERRAVAVSELAWHALLVPVEVIRRVGPPRADLFTWYEDVEYGLRLRSAGLDEWVVPEVGVSHPPPPRTVSFRVAHVRIDVPLTDPVKSYLLVRNSLVVRRAYAGARFWWADLPLTLLRALVLALKLPGPRLAILRQVLVRGVLDAARGRMGPPPAGVAALSRGTR